MEALYSLNCRSNFNGLRGIIRVSPKTTAVKTSNPIDLTSVWIHVDSKITQIFWAHAKEILTQLSENVAHNRHCKTFWCPMLIYVNRFFTTRRDVRCPRRSIAERWTSRGLYFYKFLHNSSVLGLCAAVLRVTQKTVLFLDDHPWFENIKVDLRDHLIAQAVSRWLVTEAARIRV
jgi:hypothetical protein